MSTTAIIAIAICTLLGWGSLVQAVEAVLVARAKARACPSRDLTVATAPTVRFSTEGSEALKRSFDAAARDVH